MFEKNMRIAYLCDFYIDLLDEHSQGIMRAYYEDDLSLAEIAADVGISRQGIRHVIKKCEEQILFLEEKLGLARRYEELEKSAKALKSVKDELLSSSLGNKEELASKLDSTINTILNK